MMNESKFSLERETHEAYGSVPNIHRYPAHEMGEYADVLKNEVSLGFQNAVHEALKDPRFEDEFKERVASKEMDIPPIEIFDTPESVRETLDRLGYGDYIEKTHSRDALLVVHLPESMRFWHEDDTTLNDDQARWRLLYALSLQGIYNGLDGFLVREGLSLYRLNPIGVHDNADRRAGYYYVWVLSSRKDDEDI